MNLVTEAWIPVVRPNGKPDTASLMQVFTEGKQFSDLAVRPHERIALMRLLICIAQAALDGPEDIEAWDKASEILPGAAKRYFDDWQDSFNLYHPEKPFLQVSWPVINNDADKSTAISKLDSALASGNNSTLFDHAGLLEERRTFPAATTALMLITFQSYAQGGGISPSIWKVKPKNFVDAPCKPSSMLHTFVRQETLFNTICANLLTKETVSVHFNGGQYWGKPIWEMMPSSFEDAPAKENTTQTYLGRLVPISRLVRLKEQNGAMLLASGFEYPRYPEFPAEASATIVTSHDGTERKLLGAGAKAIWRELHALTVLRRQAETGGALALSNVANNKALDIWVGALLIDQKKTAEVLDTVESVFHIPSRMHTDDGRAAYSAEVRWAESLAGKLGWAVETYRKESDGGWEGRLKTAKDKNKLRGQLHATATRHYWTAVEKLRPLLMAHVEAIGTTAEAVQNTRNAWRRAVHGAARQAYELACGQETPRQIRAFALGWAKLFAKQQSNDAQEPETVETED